MQVILHAGRGRTPIHARYDLDGQAAIVSGGSTCSASISSAALLGQMRQQAPRRGIGGHGPRGYVVNIASIEGVAPALPTDPIVPCQDANRLLNVFL